MQWRWVVRGFFNQLYRRPDPYGVRRDEHVAKFDRAFGLFSGSSFNRGLDLGCGEGWNTWRVAQLCQSVMALDISSRAIDRARQIHDLSNVNFQCLDIVTDALPDVYDYIHCSDMLYYLSLPQLPVAIHKIVAACTSGGLIHLVNARSAKDDDSGLTRKPFGARTIHELFTEHIGLRVLVDEQTADYRITLLKKTKTA